MSSRPCWGGRSWNIEILNCFTVLSQINWWKTLKSVWARTVNKGLHKMRSHLFPYFFDYFFCLSHLFCFSDFRMAYSPVHLCCLWLISTQGRLSIWNGKMHKLLIYCQKVSHNSWRSATVPRLLTALLSAIEMSPVKRIARMSESEMMRRVMRTLVSWILQTRTGDCKGKMSLKISKCGRLKLLFWWYRTRMYPVAGRFLICLFSLSLSFYFVNFI